MCFCALVYNEGLCFVVVERGLNAESISRECGEPSFLLVYCITSHYTVSGGWFTKSSLLLSGEDEGNDRTAGAESHEPHTGRQTKNHGACFHCERTRQQDVIPRVSVGLLSLVLFSKQRFPQGDDTTPGSTRLTDVSGLNPATPVGLAPVSAGLDPPQSGCIPAASSTGAAGGAPGSWRRRQARPDLPGVSEPGLSGVLLYGLDRGRRPSSALPALECASTTLSSAPRVHRLGRPLRGGAACRR
ncbi:unnamed protein product [Arctogadus glacialis]